MKHNTREYVIMIASGTLTMFSGGLVWPIFAAYVRTEFNAPLQLVGIAVSGYFLLRMITEFPIGALSDRIGPKRLLVTGRVLAVFSAFVCFQTNNIGLLIFARMVWGIGDASFFCIGTSYVSKLFSSEKRGRALGLFQGIEMIGNLLGQALGGYFADTFGLRMNFLASGVMAVTALSMVIFLRGTPAGAFNIGLRSLLPNWSTIRRVLNRTVMTICFINLGCMIIMHGLTGAILPIFVTEEIGLSLSTYAILVVVNTIGNISGNLTGGMLSDKFGRKKMLLAGFVTGIFAITGFIVFRSFFTLMFAMFFMGTFWGSVYGIAPAYIADTVKPEYRGIGIGAYRTFFDFGGLIGPVIVSTIAGAFGGIRGYLYAFYFCLIVVVGLIVLALTLKETAAERNGESTD